MVASEPDANMAPTAVTFLYSTLRWRAATECVR